MHLPCNVRRGAVGSSHGGLTHSVHEYSTLMASARRSDLQSALLIPHSVLSGGTFRQNTPGPRETGSRCRSAVHSTFWPQSLEPGSKPVAGATAVGYYGVLMRPVCFTAGSESADSVVWRQLPVHWPLLLMSLRCVHHCAPMHTSCPCSCQRGRVVFTQTAPQCCHVPHAANTRMTLIR